MIVALVDDLMFGSKIRAACQAAGVPLETARTPDRAMATLRAQADPSGIIVVLDLDRDPLEPLRVIREVRSDPAMGGVRLVAFVRHTSTDRIVAAREAGADVVLARSAFFPALPEILSGLRGAGPVAAAPARPS